MLHVLVLSLALNTIAPTANPSPVSPRKPIANIGSGDERRNIVRYFDAELNVACYVTSSNYYQTRLACVKL